MTAPTQPSAPQASKPAPQASKPAPQASKPAPSSKPAPRASKPAASSKPAPQASKPKAQAQPQRKTKAQPKAQAQPKTAQPTPQPGKAAGEAARRVSDISEKAAAETQEAAERVAESNEKTAEKAVSLTEHTVEQNRKVVEVGKRTVGAYLDSYEKAWLSITDVYESAARATKVDWIATVASAQASLAREVAHAQTSAARELASYDLTETGAAAVAQVEGQVKGAVAGESDLAIARYDSLTADEITSRLPELSQIDLAKVDSYEGRNQNRSTVLDRISTLRGNEPWAGYDELTVTEIQSALSDGDDERAQQVRTYERAHKNRAGVLQTVKRELSNA